jgi:TolB-like protein/DNA-binding winged helix-turn-helix (wHTH) protein
VFGDAEIHLVSREVFVHGDKARLPWRAFDVLRLLAQADGEVVPKEEILRRVWGGEVVCDSNLTQAIAQIRKALDPPLDGKSYVETVPRIGYRLSPAAKASHTKASLNGHVVPTAQSPPIVQRLVSSNRFGLAALIALAAIPLSGGFALYWTRVPDWRAEAGTINQSIAVLPIEDLSKDPEQEYFSSGITASLILNLAKIGAIRVVSAYSGVPNHKGRETPTEIGRELGVDYVLSGTVERHGEHARLSAHLISATTGRQVWAEIYDRDLQAIPALHAMMSQIIARELHVQITPKEQVRLSRVRPVNRDAYEAYLKGRYYQAKRTGDGLTKSIAYFQEAVSKDPGYGQAYAGFADTYTYMANHGFLPPRDAAPRAKAMAAKALEIDDTLAEGHTSIAYIRMVYDWDWPGAEREFRRSIELDPSYAKAHSLFACYFALLRRFDEAIGEVRQALELDPLSIYDNTNFGWHAVCRAPVHRGHRSISEDAGHGSGQCPDAFLSWASVGTGGVVRRSYRRIPKGHKPDRRHSCHFRRACPCLRAIRQCS